MQIFLKSLLALGFIMVMGVVFVAIDQYATDERKEAFNAQVDSVTDAMAETPDDSGCRRRCAKGLWHSIQSLANGVFRSAPIDLADVMPTAPQGWEQRDYTVADGEALTGEPLDAGPVHSGEIHRVLRNFSKSSEGKSLGSAMTYQSGDRVVVIRLQSKLDNFRKADAGTYAEKQKMLSMKRPPSDATLYMTVDGHPVGVMPQFTRVKDRRYPTEYRRFIFSIGHIVEGEILAKASDADLVNILGGIDFAGVQAVLDEPTERFVLGKGVEWAGEGKPSAELPPLTVAYRAHLLLRAAGGLERDDFETLKVMARGEAATWEELAVATGLAYQKSDDVIELLGEEPPGFAAARVATGYYVVHRARLEPNQRRALAAIADREVKSQTEMRAADYWQDEWDPVVAKVIAMLPE